MSVTIDSILNHRRQVAARASRLGVWASLVVHAGLVAALVATPLLTPEPTREAVRFVSVALVSAQALGVRDPEPAPPPKAEPRPAPAEPAPAPPKPKPKASTTPKAQPATPTPAAPTTPELRRRAGSPTGSTTGTAALGARVGFDNPNFKHSYYIDQLTAMLASQWQRPALGGDIVALVSFTIDSSGKVSDIHVVESSGYSSYDLASLRAVQQAAPFPPLPQSYTQETLGVTVEFI